MHFFKPLCRSLLCLSSLLPFAIYATTSPANEAVDLLIMEQIPYGFQTPDNRDTGVLFDIALKLHQLSERADNLNTNTPTIIPTKRIITLLNQARPTCTIVADTPIISNHYDMIEPIGFKLAAGILPAAGVSVTSYESLTGKSIAVPLGIMFDNRFHEDQSLNKVSVPQYLNGVKMIAAGRVDSVAGAISSLKYAAKMQNISADNFGTPYIFHEVEVYFVCNSQLPDTQRAKFKQLIIDMKNDGTIPQILDHYFNLSSLIRRPQFALQS
ncbi:substrate-binding periplasmic protein [Vibrio profundi]|uniref:substrate-binding periplasmic protein n=1 Tax=Vibrio profundi TaxID=1774960 RepID=UPI003736EFD9